MEQKEVIQIFNEVNKIYNKRNISLNFTDKYKWTKGSNGCCVVNEDKIIVNWQTLKNKTEEDVYSFIKHEFGHFVVVDIALWLAKKINKVFADANKTDIMSTEKFLKVKEHIKNVEMLIKQNESQATLFGDLMYDGVIR